MSTLFSSSIDLICWIEEVRLESNNWLALKYWVCTFEFWTISTFVLGPLKYSTSSSISSGMNSILTSKDRGSDIGSENHNVSFTW